MKPIAFSDDVLLAFLEALPWPTLVMDLDGVVTGVGENADGQLFDDACVNRHLAEIAPEYASVLVGDAPWTAPQYADVTRDGADNLVHERIHLRAIPEGYCLIIENRNAYVERKIADMQTNRLATLGFMIAGVSHEVSNPLTAMRSMVQILLAGDNLSPETMKKGLANISANVQRLMDISRRLVEFSRVGDAPRSAFPIDYAISEALIGLLPDERFANISVDLQENSSAVVYAHAGQLQEVFTNILLNSAQAIGGEGRIRIASTVCGNTVDVLFEDDGPGIEPGVIGKIFEPFFTTKPTGKGTGLGLAICSEILREHGGTIGVRNNVERGACFQIRLPAFRD